MIADQVKSECADGEIMISAYCTGEGSTLHVNGTGGASCEGGSNNVVVVCSKR